MACIYTKQFSDKPTTEENTSTVVGQIIKNQGKTLFQIIAMTEDMELAGKAKNTLLKMGFEDSKENVKQFAGSKRFVEWLNDAFGKDLKNLDEVETQIVKDRNGKNVYLVKCPLSKGTVYSWCYEVNGLLGKPNLFKDVNSFKSSLYPLGIKEDSITISD